ncbi:hypothetical protein JNL27_16390, partial [bacterium]|nr:hypothetical protein [bacterium]
IEDFLIILSLIEGDFINWYYCIGSEHSLAGFPLSEIELFQLAVKIKKTNFDSIRYHRFRKSLQKLHRYLTLLYSQKNVDDKKSIKKLIEKFVIASRTSAVDTRLIYWHSCLDVIIKKCDGKGKSFSHKLIDACKNMNIEWLDIYVGITEESLDLKAEFPLNRIRNEILHDGIYPDDYGEVIKENRNARALCERFITQIIGADYRDTGFGKVDNSYY